MVRIDIKDDPVQPENPSQLKKTDYSLHQFLLCSNWAKLSWGQPREPVVIVRGTKREVR